MFLYLIIGLLGIGAIGTGFERGFGRLATGLTGVAVPCLYFAVLPELPDGESIGAAPIVVEYTHQRVLAEDAEITPTQLVISAGVVNQFGRDFETQLRRSFEESQLEGYRALQEAVHPGTIQGGQPPSPDYRTVAIELLTPEEAKARFDAQSASRSRVVWALWIGVLVGIVLLVLEVRDRLFRTSGARTDSSSSPPQND